MFSVNKKAGYIQLATGAIPAVLSVSFLVNESGVLLLFCVLSLFIIVGVVPLFKRRESLWMFILVAVAGAPVNIVLSNWIILEGFIDTGFLIGDILWGLLLCCTFFSVEEIAFGVVTRMIWKKQYKINI